MRILPTTLAQKLDGGVTSLARAWRITRRDGIQVAATQHDRDLFFDGTLFAASQIFAGSASETEANLAPNRTALSGALTIDTISKRDLELGRWDHAKVEAFLVDWENPADFISLWTGAIAGASWRENAFELDIVGPEAALNRDIGRVYSRSCDAALGDARCKVDMAEQGRTLTTALVSVEADRKVTIGAPSNQVAQAFAAGALRVESGIARSWTCGIAKIDATATSWTIHTARPFPVAPSIGDIIRLSVGCDKSFPTCKARFANALNFRGQPTLPGDDVAFGGPSPSGNSGGKR